MPSCPRTRAYVARRTAEGKTTREIRRCLKRYIARELHRTLTATMINTTMISTPKSELDKHRSVTCPPDSPDPPEHPSCTYPAAGPGRRPGFSCGTTPSATAHPPPPDTHPADTRPEHPIPWKSWTDQRLRQASDTDTHDQFEPRSPARAVLRIEAKVCVRRARRPGALARTGGKLFIGIRRVPPCGAQRTAPGAGCCDTPSGSRGRVVTGAGRSSVDPVDGSPLTLGPRTRPPTGRVR